MSFGKNLPWKKMGKRTVPDPDERSLKKPRYAEKLVVNPEKPWYMVKIKEKWEEAKPGPEGNNLKAEELKRKATGLYKNQVDLFNKQRDISKSDREWLTTVTSSGTASDKASAFLLQIQEAPLYSIEFIRGLVEISKSKSRHESSFAVSSLLEAFRLILPPIGVRKLYYLKQRNWECADTLSEKTLIICYFEDVVKRSFFEFMKVLEIMLQDQIAYNRGTAMRILSQLASEKDEQLPNMMSMLVNKLGDPDRKLSSRSVYYLQGLIDSHPDLTLDVVKAVELLIFRPGINERCQVYGLNFLSQIRLSHENPALTEKILIIYKAILCNVVIPALKSDTKKESLKKRKNRNKNKRTKATLGNAQDEDINPSSSRIAKLVTIGINRAIPFYAGSRNLLDELSLPINTLLHCANLTTVLQALNLYYLIASADSGKGFTESFIITVQKVLARHEILQESSSYPLLMTILYKIVCNPDLNVKNTEIIVKEIVRLCCRISSSSFVIASLLLIGEVIQNKGSILAMLSLPAEYSEEFTVNELASSSLWELHLFAKHFHPLISKIASRLLNNESVAEFMSSNTLKNHNVLITALE